jgi:choline dehydrogenase-like flavoprotein
MPNGDRATHIVIGGGSSGCIIASRLSEHSSNRVVPIEAGPDFPPDATPPDISERYGGRALGSGLPARLNNFGNL